MGDYDSSSVERYMRILEAQYKSVESSKLVKKVRADGFDAIDQNSLDEFIGLMRRGAPTTDVEKIIVDTIRFIAKNSDQHKFAEGVIKPIPYISVLVSGRMVVAGLNAESLLSIDFEPDRDTVSISRPRLLPRSMDGHSYHPRRDGLYFQYNPPHPKNNSRGDNWFNGNNLRRTGRRSVRIDKKQVLPVLDAASRRGLIEELDLFKNSETCSISTSSKLYSEVLIAGRLSQPLAAAALKEPAAPAEPTSAASAESAPAPAEPAPAKPTKAAKAAKPVKAVTPEEKTGGARVKFADDAPKKWGDIVSDEEKNA